MNKSKKLMNSMDKLNQEFVDLIEQIKKKKEKIYQIAKKFRGERIKRKSKIPQLKIQNFKRR